MKVNQDIKGAAAGPDYSASVAGDDPRIAEFVRLPKPGARLYGLSRSWWNSAIETGQVRSVCLRKRGALRGARLMLGDDVRNLIRGEFEKQNANKELAAV